MPSLTNQRWELYAKGIAKGLTSDAAYTQAGYKPNRKNATRLKTNKDVIARVLELQEKREERLILNKTYVVDALLENAEKALGRKPVRVGAVGKEKDVYLYEGAVANAAIRMAGQELGLFIDRKDVRISTEYDKLTDAQLAEQLVKVGQLMLEDQSVIEHDDGE